MRSGQEGQSFRPRSSAWSTAAAWTVVVGLTAAQAVDGGTAAVLRAVPVAVGFGVLSWLVFWHPRVDVDDTGVTLVNPLRTVTVPWHALIQVETQYALTLVTPSGRFRAWAAPGPGRHQVLTAGGEEVAAVSRTARDSRGAVGIGDLHGSPSGRVADVVRRRWQRLVEDEELVLGVADETPVRWHWNVWALALLAVAAAGALAAVLA